MISGCKDMIRLIFEPDDCFAKVKPEKMVDEDCVCRLKFPDIITDKEDYAEYLMTYTVDSKVLARFTDEDLLRDENGNIQYAKQDLHWGLAEQYRRKPREVLNKKADRGAGKTANFACAYGASGDTLERKIEADTGVKPEPGTGQALLQALYERQPRAFEFMEEMERKPEDPGYVICKSGRVRHFHLHDKTKQDWWSYKSHLSSQGRESRNIYMQESVAATASRATVWLLEFKRLFELKGRPCAVLYDSVVTLCPYEERRVWRKAHDLFLYLGNGWEYEDRTLRYAVDHELNKSWSFKPTKEELKEIEDCPCSTEFNTQKAEQWLDNLLKVYKTNEKASLLGVGWALVQEKTKKV